MAKDFLCKDTTSQQHSKDAKSVRFVADVINIFITSVSKIGQEFRPHFDVINNF